MISLGKGPRILTQVPMPMMPQMVPGQSLKNSVVVFAPGYLQAKNISTNLFCLRYCDDDTVAGHATNKNEYRLLPILRGYLSK